MPPRRRSSVKLQTESEVDDKSSLDSAHGRGAGTPSTAPTSVVTTKRARSVKNSTTASPILGENAQAIDEETEEDGEEQVRSR